MSKATKPLTRDQLIDQLLAAVTLQKAEIKKAERPKYETNMSFGDSESSSNRTNLNVVFDKNVLLNAYAFLTQKEKAIREAAEELKVELDGPLTWLGYPIETWKTDIRTRLSVILIATKRKKLEQNEERLNELVTPERREELRKQQEEQELLQMQKELLG